MHPKTQTLLLWSGGLLLVAMLLWWAAPASQPSPSETIPEAPERMVAMAPSITELVFALGAGDKLVGVSSFSSYPPQAQDLPSLGGQLDPDLEGILRLDPDLVITLGYQPQLSSQLNKLQIPTLSLPMDSLAELNQAYALLGERLKAQAQAQSLSEALHTALSLAHTQIGQQQAPPVVALFIARQTESLRGLYAAGDESYLGEVLAAMGAINAFSGNGRWPAVGIEEVFRADPDVIIELYPSGPLCPKNANLQRLWQTHLPQLQAVKKGRIHAICEDYAVVPGPRLPLLIGALTDLLLTPPVK